MAIKEIVLKNVDKKQVKNPSMIKEQINKPKIKIMQMPEVPKVKENKKNQENIKNINIYRLKNLKTIFKKSKIN